MLMMSPSGFLCSHVGCYATTLNAAGGQLTTSVSKNGEVSTPIVKLQKPKWMIENYEI
jgi:hypothetical protein